VVRQVYVAETNAEARDKAVHSMLGRTCRDYLLLRFGTLNLTGLFKHHSPLPNVRLDDSLAVA
jgi:hypothetical protein